MWPAAVVALVVPLVADAYVYPECRGEPIRWTAPEVPLKIMPCSAPAGSHRALDLIAGIEAWNAIPGNGVRLRPETGSETCRIVVNGQSELGYVEPAQIDGARGATRVVHNRACTPGGEGRTARGPQALVETDMIIADFPHDVSGLPDNCDEIDRNAPLRRALVMHEVGHILGFLHEDDAMAVMNASASGGRYCGARALVPHPDDGAGVRAMYPGPDDPVRDIAASGMWLSRPNYSEPVLPPYRYAVCPGELLPVRWSAANLGNVDAVTTVRWYISDNDIISSRDRVAATVPDVVIPAGGFVSRTHDLRVPSGLSTGPGEALWLGFMVDADRGDWEVPSSNNATYTSLRLTLRPEADCAAL